MVRGGRHLRWDLKAESLLAMQQEMATKGGDFAPQHNSGRHRKKGQPHWTVWPAEKITAQKYSERVRSSSPAERSCLSLVRHGAGRSRQESWFPRPWPDSVVRAAHSAAAWGS
jgi:hypothetical protein